MYKLKIFYRRNRLIVGGFLLVISFCLMGFNNCNSKININSLKMSDVAFAAMENPEVGETSFEKIVANQPYTSIEEVKEINGIGEVKYKQIKKNYATYEPCRRNIYYLSVGGMVMLCVIGFILVRCEYEGRLRSTEDLIKTIIRKE